MYLLRVRLRDDLGNKKEGKRHNLVKIFSLSEGYGQIFIGGIK